MPTPCDLCIVCLRTRHLVDHARLHKQPLFCYSLDLKGVLAIACRDGSRGRRCICLVVHRQHAMRRGRLLYASCPVRQHVNGRRCVSVASSCGTICRAAHMSSNHVRAAAGRLTSGPQHACDSLAPRLSFAVAARCLSKRYADDSS